MKSLDHARSSVELFGGSVSDYLAIHEWFDETKQYAGDWTHRALRHHSAGVRWAVEKFGTTIKNTDGVYVSVQSIAEQHVEEDCGFVPTPERWLSVLRNHPEDWMLRVGKVSKEIGVIPQEAPASVVPEEKISDAENPMVQPLPEKLRKRILEYATGFTLHFSGGSDESYLNIDIVWRDPDADYPLNLDADIEDWAWQVFDYGGAGDGTDYGDDVEYDLENNVVRHREWYAASEYTGGSTHKLPQ